MGPRKESPIEQLGKADILRFRRPDTYHPAVFDLIISCDTNKIIKIVADKFKQRDKFGHLSGFDNLLLGLDQLHQNPITKIQSMVSGALKPVDGKLQRQIKISTNFCLKEGLYLDPKCVAFFQENLRSFNIKNTTFQPNNDGTASFLINNLEGTYNLRFPTTSLKKNPNLVTLNLTPRQNNFGFPFETSGQVAQFFDTSSYLTAATFTSLSRAIVGSPAFGTISKNINISWPIDWKRYDIEL